MDFRQIEEKVNHCNMVDDNVHGIYTVNVTVKLLRYGYYKLIAVCYDMT